MLGRDALSSPSPTNILLSDDSGSTSDCIIVAVVFVVVVVVVVVVGCRESRENSVVAVSGIATCHL